MSTNHQSIFVLHVHFWHSVYIRKDRQKVVTRHIWQEYVEEADHLRHHKDVKPIYAKRKETIERIFADAKEKHGMSWTSLRGLKRC